MELIREALNEASKEYNGYNLKELIGPLGRLADPRGIMDLEPWEQTLNAPNNALLDQTAYTALSRAIANTPGWEALERVDCYCVIDLSETSIERAMSALEQGSPTWCSHIINM
jgi:hypothetical protein